MKKFGVSKDPSLFEASSYRLNHRICKIESSYMQDLYATNQNYSLFPVPCCLCPTPVDRKTTLVCSQVTRSTVTYV